MDSQNPNEWDGNECPNCSSSSFYYTEKIVRELHLTGDGYIDNGVVSAKGISVECADCGLKIGDYIGAESI